MSKESNQQLDALPLEELVQQCEIARSLSWRDVQASLLRRIRAGALDEVCGFLTHCARHWHDLYDVEARQKLWLRDEALWWRLAEVLIGRDYRLECSDSVPPPGAESSGRLCRLLEDRVHQQRRAGGLTPEVVSLVAHSLSRLQYPDMLLAERMALLDWLIALYTEVGASAELWYLDVAFIAALPQEAREQLAARSPELATHMLRVHGWELDSGRRQDGWLPWRKFLLDQPDPYALWWMPDVVLLEPQWERSDTPERAQLLGMVLRMVEQCPRVDRSASFALFARMLQQEPQLFADALMQYEISPRVALLLWRSAEPLILSALLPGLARNLWRYDGRTGLRRLIPALLARRPADIAGLSWEKLADVLSILPPQPLQACLPYLGKTLSSTSAKPLREALVDACCTLPASALSAAVASWLQRPNRNLLNSCREVLLACNDPAVVPLLQQLLDTGKLDLAAHSAVSAHLQQLSGSCTVECDLTQLESLVASQPKFSAASEFYASSENLALMAPLSPQAARTLLHLACEPGDSLPPLAWQLLAQIPLEPRTRLLRTLADAWLASGGEPALRWVMRLVLPSADASLASQLAARVRLWQQDQYQRAVVAVEYLAQIGSSHALMYLREFATSRKLRAHVSAQARAWLAELAAQRGLSLSDLYDELLPDFGLGEGVELTVGPERYRIELQGDLSLRLRDAQGKACKTLPRPRASEWQADWEAASSELKVLKSSLRQLVKQQEARLHGALLTGQHWPLARWQCLFLQHAVLRRVAQSLIWRSDAGQSFRIAEDLSLVDVQDDPVTLAPDSQISLWHPLTAATGEAAAWRAYLADYQLQPLVDQLGAPARLPSAADLAPQGLRAAPELEVPQGRLSSLLTRLGYRKGELVEEAGFPGPSVDGHSLQIEALGLQVDLEHGYFPPWMEVDNPVAIYGLQVFELENGDCSEPLDPSSLPPILQASLLDHLQQMRALAHAD